MARTFFALIFALLTAAAVAQSSTLEVARKALAGEDFQAQITALDSLAGSGRKSPELYQALGNAYFERGDFGRAILQYERGLRLRPNHKELKNNLQFVREEAGITRPELPDFFLVRAWRAVGAAIGARTAFWLAMVWWWLAVAGAVIWFLRRQAMEEKKRFALLPGAFIALVMALLFFLLGNSRNGFLANDQEAVLIAKSVDLRVAPGPDATLEQALSAGLKLRILDEFDNYVKVSLEDGKQGWLPVAAVEVI